MKVLTPGFAAALTLTASLKVASHAATFGLESLDLQYAEQGWGEPQADRSVDNHPIFIDGKRFEHGFGTHAVGTLGIGLNGQAESFSATVGVDDEVGQRGSVVFRVVGDGKTLWESAVLRGGSPGTNVSVDLRGIKKLVLTVGDAGDDISYDHADWADAKIVMAEGKPQTIAPVRKQGSVITIDIFPFFCASGLNSWKRASTHPS
jgi:alpha-galactosidase